MLGIGFTVGELFGWSFYDSMFLAAALSISATAVIIKVLEDRGSMETTSGLLLTGILVIEDIIAIVKPTLPTFLNFDKGKASPTPNNKRTIAMSEKLFSISIFLMRPNGPNGPIKIPAARKPRIKGCLKI